MIAASAHYFLPDQLEPVVLGQHRDAVLLAPRRAWSRRRGRRPDSRSSSTPSPTTFAPSRSAIALASSRVIFSSEPVNTTVLPATGVSVLRLLGVGDRHLLDQPLDASCGCASRRSSRRWPRSRSRRSGRARPSRLASPRRPCDDLQRGVVERLPGAVAARERDRRGLADVADAERIDEALQRNLAPRLDRLEQIADRGLAVALDLLELDLACRAPPA